MRHIQNGGLVRIIRVYDTAATPAVLFTAGLMPLAAVSDFAFGFRFKPHKRLSLNATLVVRKTSETPFISSPIAQERFWWMTNDGDVLFLLRRC